MKNIYYNLLFLFSYTTLLCEIPFDHINGLFSSINPNLIISLLPFDNLESVKKLIPPLVASNFAITIIPRYLEQLKTNVRLLDIRMLIAHEIAKQNKINLAFIIDALFTDPQAQEYIYWGDLAEALLTSKNQLYIERIINESINYQNPTLSAGQIQKIIATRTDVIISQLLINADQMILDSYLKILNTLPPEQKQQGIKKIINGLLTVSPRMMQHKNDVYQFVVNNKENIDNVADYITKITRIGHTELATMLQQ